MQKVHFQRGDAEFKRDSPGAWKCTLKRLPDAGSNLVFALAMSHRLVTLLLLASCAGPSALTQKDSESIAETQPSPNPESEELSQVWDKTEEATAVAKPAMPPAADRWLGFKAALAQGQAQYKSRQFELSRASAQTAIQEAAALDGEARMQAGQLMFRIELASEASEPAFEAAIAWRLACGPERVGQCRNAALTALASVAKQNGADPKLGKRSRELLDAENCSVTSRPAGCEWASIRVAQREGDLFVWQRIALNQALKETNEAQRMSLLEKAERICEKPACAGQRRKALNKLLLNARSKGDTESAVKFALREVGVIMTTLPPGAGTWTRTAALDQICVAYDAAHGAGSCRALEKQTLGQWTFHDFSVSPPSKTLSATQVRTTNEHFAPLLEECLTEQARRLRPPDAQRYDVRWTVFNDGRVGEVHLRKDLDETPLAQCLRNQFNEWRYPRYAGEYQNVEQSFTVTAVERRSATR